MPHKFDPTDTSVREIHEIICDEAVVIANNLITQDGNIANKWKGQVLRNMSPYNEGRLSLEITEEYRMAPDRVKGRYLQTAAQAIRMAVMQNQELFVGMILGEARAGRNYFESWDQAPSTLFD